MRVYKMVPLTNLPCEFFMTPRPDLSPRVHTCYGAINRTAVITTDVFNSAGTTSAERHAVRHK